LSKRIYKIGLDAHALAAVGTGNHSYLRGLIEGLAQVDPKNKYLLYDAARAPLDVINRAAKNFSVRNLYLHSALARNVFSVPLAQRLDGLDLYHGQFFLPLGLNCKTVVSIHDLCFEHYPEFFRLSERALLPRLVRAAARRADEILTLSEFSKQDIAQRYRVDAAKIHVVAPGIEPHFKPIQDAAILDAIRARYALPQSFILFYGRTDPRKGADVLIQAYQKLLAQGAINSELIIAGRAGSADAALRALVQNGGLGARVRFIGIVPDQDLAGVISAATCVVYPSIFEGFGLPALEAMACGTPVITTNASALPEVMGDTELMFEPGNVDALARILKRLLDSETARARAIAEGLARAQMFSWTRSARQALAVYEHVLAA